ncbi:MAG: DUF72 domain-containing protein [Calditrichaeota bacterium]|nr:MAG: DUF72 domain-containing protein [Calditrichota bacterium]
MSDDKLFKIGTCSWKYDSWVGLIYSEMIRGNYLHEYAAHYPIVEVDQWFWSLFPNSPIKLPDPGVAATYAAAVPDDFRFTIKVPNSITLTHYYNHDKKSELVENPHFMSNDLFERFLQNLTPLEHKLGPLIFQFEYLNKQKMPAQQIFFDKLQEFLANAPTGFHYAIETRNPNYLNKNYFDFLLQNQLSHVFLQGYFMPSIIGIYEKFKSYLTDSTVIRLHGPNRKEIEKTTGNKWDKIVAPKDDELVKIIEIVKELMENKVEIVFHVNNHYEGSAPKTIDKILSRLS